MAVNEFVFDVSEFQESGEGVEREEDMEVEEQRGWRKEKGRYLCLVNNCRERKVDFAQKFALTRHWEDVHRPTLEIFKCNVRSSCQSFKRAYDLERHYRKRHDLPADNAKLMTRRENLKGKLVENRNFISPGSLVGPKGKSVAGHGKRETDPRPVPAESVLCKLPKAPKVTVEVDNTPDSDVEIDLPDVPEPIVRNVKGASLSSDEQSRKDHLIKEILKAKEMLKLWAQREKEAKEELKGLEVKEQRVREKALQEELRGERSERRRMEVEMRKLKGQVDKSKSVVQDSEVFRYEELVFGEEFHFEE